MTLVQELNSQKQTMPLPEGHPVGRGRSGLGDASSQIFPNQPHRNYGLPVAIEWHPFEKLQTLKRKHFTAQGRNQRIERSLAALNQVETLRLTPREWRFFAEDPDLADQD